MPRRPTENVTDAQHAIQIQVLEKDIGGVATRFDRHLEIYAQNGKELAALKVSVQQVHEVLGDVKVALENIDDKFVTTKEFSPVKSIAFSLVGTTALAVLGGLLALILKA